MTLLTSETAPHLWHDAVKYAEARCSISLKQDLEAYLISLLIRYTNKPEVVQQIFAKAYLQAFQHPEMQRCAMLQNVGDQCLLFAGLFPQQAETRHVKISYFVDMGRSAYSTISQSTHDLYFDLSFRFVTLMDVLQSMRETPDLQPLQAYEQWHELGSQRALQVLKELTKGLPLKKF